MNRKSVLDDKNNYCGMTYFHWKIIGQHIMLYDSPMMVFSIQCSCGYTKKINKSAFMRKYLKEKCHSCIKKEYHEDK